MLKPRPTLLALAAVLSLAAAACGSDATTAADTTASTTATTAATTATTAKAAAASSTTAAAGASTTAGAPATTRAPIVAGQIALETTPLGSVLVDAQGNTIYLYTPDKQGISTCYDKCEAAWPIVSQVSGVGTGLDAKLLGTTTRTNGTVQATYNKWPLYYFVKDKAKGDTTGQAVGGVWWVMDAKGDAIGAK